jgi:hypothetical protein
MERLSNSMIVRLLDRRFACWMIAGVVSLAALAGDPHQASAVTLTLDYSYDSSNFFGAGNPGGAVAGAQAKATLQAVASFYSTILTDTFSAIETPPDFHSSTFDGLAFWHWTQSFPNPATGNQVTLTDQTISANEYRIYAGARDLTSPNLGIGGPGGFSFNSDNNGGSFTTAEIDQLNDINSNFQSAVMRRGEPSGFASWGGAITFDNVGVNWHYDYQTPPSAGKNDFYSVALHELGHALGLGASDEWNSFLSGNFFTGPQATAAYGSNPPISPTSSGHWAAGTTSVALGTSTTQQALMTPSIVTGTRKQLTALDAGALTDIGWFVSPPTSFNPADFNHSRSVNSADLAVWKGAYGANLNGNADGDSDTDGNDFLIWQRQLGAASSVTAAAPIPEPATAALLFFGATVQATWLRAFRRSIY